MGKELTAEVVEAKRKKMRSAVRVCITYGAGAYVLLGGVMLMATALFGGETTQTVDGVTTTTSAMFGEAKDVFLATLPIATGILTYWFADRSATKGREEPPNDTPKRPDGAS